MTYSSPLNTNLDPGTLDLSSGATGTTEIVLSPTLPVTSAKLCVPLWLPDVSTSTALANPEGVTLTLNVVPLGVALTK